MTDNDPLISVITPVYNGERFVARTIASVLGQSFKNFEYILIDDASTDASLEIIKSFDDPRIQILQNTVNSRLVTSRNRGLETARGRYVALLDHDDIALPQRLEKQFKAMEADKNLVLIGSQIGYINANDELTSTRTHHQCPSPEYCRAKLLFRNHFVNSTVFFRQLKEKVMFSDQFQLAEDYDFIERYSAHGKVHILLDNLVNYRVHDNNYGSKMRAETMEGCSRIKQRLLERLGFQVDANLSRVHAMFEFEPPAYTYDNLRELADLAVKIMAANQKSRFFEPSALREVVSFELLKIAESAAKNPLLQWREIFTDPYLGALLHPPSGFARAALKYFRSRMAQ